MLFYNTYMNWTNLMYQIEKKILHLLDEFFSSLRCVCVGKGCKKKMGWKKNRPSGRSVSGLWWFHWGKKSPPLGSSTQKKFLDEVTFSYFSQKEKNAFCVPKQKMPSFQIQQCQ